MLHDHLETPSSVDAKTAEETLALALRLQQERGERISIEELQRTADEAGIDRIYLEGALKQVAQKAHEQELEAQAAPCENRRYTIMAIAFSVAVVMAVIGRLAPRALNSPLFFIFFMGFIASAVITRRLLGSKSSTGHRRFRGF
jgi:hypothetical protein